MTTWDADDARDEHIMSLPELVCRSLDHRYIETSIRHVLATHGPKLVREISDNLAYPRDTNGDGHRDWVHPTVSDVYNVLQVLQRHQLVAQLNTGSNEAALWYLTETPQQTPTNQDPQP